MPRKTFHLLWRTCPLGLAFHWSRITCLPSWLGIVNVGWLCSRLSYQIGCIFTWTTLSIESATYSATSACSGRPFYKKILKLRFWNFKLIFLRMQFSLVATFFLLVLVICLSWYLHLKPSREFLTLVSFIIWR